MTRTLAGGLLCFLLCQTASAFDPTRTPNSPDGTHAIVDLPPSLHLRNTGGIDRFGRPGQGDGLCVYTSCEVAEARWQNGTLTGFQKWMTYKPGGGSPRKLQAMITQFCKEKGIKEPDYAQHTGGDMTFLDTAMKTRRMVCVTYSGSDDFYNGGIDHMVDLAHLDATRAAIVDSNRPGFWVWMTRKEFEVRWKARGGGWAVAFLQSPPPPAPDVKDCVLLKPQHIPFTQHAILWGVPATRAEAEAEFRSVSVSPCICGDSCSCQKGDCPGKCPVQIHQQPACRNGSCPSQPGTKSVGVKVGTNFTDRSPSSVLVSRDLGNGRTESGTGTVVKSGSKKSLILTNAHVAEDATRPLSVTTVAGKVYPAEYVTGSKVRYIDAHNIEVDGPDLALLSVAEDFPAVPVATTLPAEGTAVCLWGYGKMTDGKPTFKTGKTLSPENYTGRILRTSIPSQEGDSGSGIFNESGQLVAVGWGGSQGVQFAVRLDAVREFLAPHVGAKIPVEVGENHGILRDELDEHTRGGKRTYWINGREVGRPQALDAVAAGGLGLVDDSDRYHLSIVTSDPASAKAALADPRLATSLGKVHVQVYSPDSWVAKDRLKAPVTLQEPSPKGGKVIWTSDKIDAATLAEGLKRADPNWKPEPPPAPKVDPKPDSPSQPPANTPTDPPANPPAAPAFPTVPTPVLILIVMGVLYFLFPKKAN